MANPEITNTDPYPQLTLTVSSQYPSITVTNPPSIVLGSGGGGAQGEQGIPGSPGARGSTGTTGFGYTGAFISGFTLYMQPVVEGEIQSAIPIGTVSLVGPGESVWTNATLTNTAVGGLASSANLVGKKAIEILEEILYSYESVSFSSFSVQLSGGLGPRELGQTISGQTQSVIWTTSGPNGNWTGGSLKVYRNGTELLTGLNYDDSGNYSITHPSYSYNSPNFFNFVLQGEQSEGSNPQRSEIYYWKYKVYWGPNIASSISNFTGFSSDFADSSPTTARAFDGAGTATFFYFVIPNSGSFQEYTSFTNTANNSTVSMIGPTAVTVINPYGVSIPYKYYRTPVASAGSITIRPNL